MSLRLLGRCGQATVEAAVLLPSTMLVLALLLEPACLAYTSVVMRTAASETARVAMTDYDGDLDDCEAFALRRLAAVPEVSIFHVGGEADWEVDIERSQECVSVSIRGHARPLPLLGLLASAFSQSDSVGVVLSQGVSVQARPKWLEGEYEDWQEMWYGR